MRSLMLTPAALRDYLPHIQTVVMAIASACAACCSLMSTAREALQTP